MEPQHWILVLVAGIFIIELLIGRHRKVHRPRDIAIMLAVITSSQVTRVGMAWLTATVIGLLMPVGTGLLARVPVWAGFVGLLLVAEFCQYWIHRWAHDSKRHPLLHGMHRTHHSAPYVNVTLMYRTNLFWPLVHSYTWCAALGFYLGMPAATTAFYLTIMAWNALTHSDWRWDDAIIARVPGGARLIEAMELVFVTPRIHHTHHGYGKDGKVYRNFCTILSFYDRLFGTLHVPEGRPWRYGLPGGEHHWARQLLFPLVPLGEARRR
ncbi:MAG: hypothetical protein RL339_1611 [Pseudomonadota bacterium]|jgi:sterol desaturase/sphingolipid hydroxylase (fatty acid hydroxylase superfamily)